MASSETQNLNETQGEELQAPCSKCSGKTYHKVLLSVDENGKESDDEWEVHWNNHFQIIECQGCKTISFRKTSSNSEDWDPYDGSYNIYENLYPSRIEGRKRIDDGVNFLSSKVRQIYEETHQALNSGSPILAGIGLRALVETVCKEEEAGGNNLSQQIDGLVAKNILAPASAKVLHSIRTLGNQAAHEVRPHNDRQLGLAMDVVEHLLADVYILPKRVEAEFGKEDSKQS
jgi:hypothetical protein